MSKESLDLYNFMQQSLQIPNICMLRQQSNYQYLQQPSLQQPNNIKINQVPQFSSQSEEQQFKKLQLRQLPKDKAKIFSYISPKKSQKKNTNFPKFLIKIFFKYINCYVKEQEDKNYIHFLYNIQKQINQVGRKNFNTNELLKIFTCQSSMNLKYVNQNRRILSQILSNSQILYNQIFWSNYIKRKPDKKQQLLATKIFKIRCRSKQLAKRMQTK